MKKQLIIGCVWIGVIFGVQSCNSESLYEPYLRDLKFMLTTIKQNHPGTYNKLDPHFYKRCKRAYQKAYKQLQTATTEVECRKILEIFTHTFDDVHLRIEWNGEIRTKYLSKQQNKQFTLSINNIAQASVV